MSGRIPQGLVADADLFRALFETAPDAMIVIDRSGTIVLCNPQAERLFGYADGALAGQPIETLMPTVVRQAHVAHRTRYMDSPRVRPMGAGYELTGLRADGQAFPIEIGLSPVAASGGTLFAASIRDISETQRARQALVRARYDACVAQVSRRVLEATHNEQAFDDIPALIAKILDIPAVAVLLVDPHRAGLHVQSSIGMAAPLLDALRDNHVAAAMASHASGDNAPAEAAIDRLGSRCLPLDDTGFADAAVMPLLDRRAPMGYLLALARERGHFDRDRRYFLQSLANILAAAIQRARSEEQLAHAQRLDALGQLTGGIAHDFNNLLTVISGNLQLLETEAAPDLATRETIESAARAVERGAALTRKLLTFSRRQHLRPRAISSVQLLSDLSDMLGRTLGERIPVHAECSNDVPEVYADPGELEAALINLALNARDAMPHGGRVTITARVHRIETGGMETGGMEAGGMATGDEATGLAPGTYVVFAVADTGMGMSPEVRARALEPFFTTKGSGKGSGLGLSMVYGFVKQSGGHLHIKSQLGYGTRVELHLPCASGGVRASSEPGAATSQRGHEHVLVVEDEAEVRRIAVAFLHSLGYAAHEAPDAATALALLATHPGIDLLFSDIVLGDGMTGFELAAKARERHPALRVLFTSGYEHASMDVHDASGSFELLRKPYRREQLALALRQVLDRA